jgi:hypothetical protein
MEYVTSAQVAQLQLEGKKLLVQYTADWCSPCRALTPRLTARTLQENRQHYLDLHEDDTTLATEITKTINNLRSERSKKELTKLRQTLQIGTAQPAELKITRHDGLLARLQKEAPQIENALCTIVIQSLSPPPKRDIYEHALAIAETKLLPFLAHACNMPIAQMIPQEHDERKQALQALMLQLYDAIITQANQLKRKRRKEQARRKASWCELWGTKEALTVLMTDALDAQTETISPKNPATMAALFYELQKKLEEEHTNTWISNQKNPFTGKIAKASTYFYPLSLATLPSYLLVIALFLIASDTGYDETLSSPAAQIDNDIENSVRLLTGIANIIMFFRLTQRDLALDLGQAPTCKKFQIPIMISIGCFILTGLTYLTMKLCEDLAEKSYDPKTTSQSAANTAEVTAYIFTNYLLIGLESYAITRLASLLMHYIIMQINACGCLPEACGGRQFHTPERAEAQEPQHADADEEAGIEVVSPAVARRIAFSEALLGSEHGPGAPALGSPASALSFTPRHTGGNGVRFAEKTPEERPPSPETSAMPYNPPEVTPDSRKRTPVRNNRYGTPSKGIPTGRVLVFSSPGE